MANIINSVNIQRIKDRYTELKIIHFQRKGFVALYKLYIKRFKNSWLGRRILQAYQLGPTLFRQELGQLEMRKLLVLQ